jgi:hypothetical protein
MLPIFQSKEEPVADTPLLLFDCTFADGTLQSWSTHAATLNGNVYSPRVLKQNVFQMQISSDLGVDTIPSITIELANADSLISEIERSVGVKGGLLTVSLVFYNFANNAPSSTTQVLFKGVLDPPQLITETNFRISATNRLSLQRVALPEVRIQMRCPWTFPVTASQRQEAVTGGPDGTYSLYYNCGYSPDQPGGVGSFASGGSTPYTTCAYTRSDCTARGMFNSDALLRPTARFGGIEFVPSVTVVRSHGEKGSHFSPLDDNLAIYNDFVPMIYGTGWFGPGIVFLRNDGNLTHMELVLGIGQIQNVQKVLVNQIEIPVGLPGTNMTGTGWYTLVSPGTRNGAFNLDFTDANGNPLGDPYGSVAFLSVVVPNLINDGSSLPEVQVLIDGLLLPAYGSNGTNLGTSFSNNPAWVILDILLRIGWSIAEVDLNAFVATAAYCAEQIQTTDLFGNPIMTPRFQCNLLLKNRRSAADVIRGIRNACRLFLRYGSNGLLQLIVENTIALQQPSLPANSNATEELNGGWPAYEFGDGTNGTTGIARTAAGASSVKLSARSTVETPNRFAAEFQDAFNTYQQDSLSIVDAGDISLTGQEITSSTPVLGLPHFDQAARILQFFLSKSVQGNTTIEFQTSAKALGLSPGDIIAVTYAKEGLERQPFRVTKIQPGTNYRTATITAQWHDDLWYADTNGQTTADGSPQNAFAGVGLPRPLGGVIPDAFGVLQFWVVETWSQAPDGTATVSAAVSFAAPNTSQTGAPDTPLISLVPTIVSGTGTLAGGQDLYYAITSISSDGAESKLSFLVHAHIPAGAATYSVTLTGLSFPTLAVQFSVYRGSTPSNLNQIAAAQVPAAVFVDLGLPNTTALPPDPNYDHADFYWRLELQPEVQATIASATTIGSEILEMVPLSYTGMVVRITEGTGAGQERNVSTNNVTVLTLTSAWDLTPDSTSSFVVAPPTYQFGSTTKSSPAQFTIPNQSGAIVEISGRAANCNGIEAPYDNSLVTRWKIGGAGIVNVDSAPPPVPSFGINPGYSGGTVVFGEVGFSDFTNTSTVTAGTYQLYYLDEMNLVPAGFLTTAIAATDNQLTISVPFVGALPEYLLIGTEVIGLTSADSTGSILTCVRGACSTTAAAYGANAPIYSLIQQVVVVPFAKNFFGSPASGNWSFTVTLPNVRLISATMFATNSQGNSPLASRNFTGSVDGSLRTLSGGQLSFQVGGFLAIQVGAAPDLIIDANKAVRDIYAVVRQAPNGSPININLNLNGTHYCSLTIPNNSTTMAAALDGASLPPLMAQDLLSIDITGVGLTAPGSDLTVIIRV